MGGMNSTASSAWPHRSFTAPFTTTGRSALVRPPPWHYAGWLLNVAFRFDAAAAAPLVPPEAGKPVGTGCVHFADWQACTDERVAPRPMTPDGKPLIGSVPGSERVIVATGHNMLGLSLAAATGTLVSDLVRNGPGAGPRAFAPSRFHQRRKVARG